VFKKRAGEMEIDHREVYTLNSVQNGVHLQPEEEHSPTQDDAPYNMRKNAGN
jgi:hypothetical protein